MRGLGAPLKLSPALLRQLCVGTVCGGGGACGGRGMQRVVHTLMCVWQRVRRGGTPSQHAVCLPACLPTLPQCNGKHMYVTLVPFLEKNTGLFMKVRCGRDRCCKALSARRCMHALPACHRALLHRVLACLVQRCRRKAAMHRPTLAPAKEPCRVHVRAHGLGCRD